MFFQFSSILFTQCWLHLRLCLGILLDFSGWSHTADITTTFPLHPIVTCIRSEKAIVTAQRWRIIRRSLGTANPSWLPDLYACLVTFFIVHTHTLTLASDMLHHLYICTYVYMLIFFQQMRGMLSVIWFYHTQKLCRKNLKHGNVLFAFTSLLQ